MKKIYLMLAVSLEASVAFADNISTVTTFMFDSDRTKVNATEQEKLNKLASESNIIRITVDGYSDKLGPVAKNQKLAQERANNIKQALLAKNVSANLITAAGHGSQDAQASERCFSQFGKDNYWVIERIKRDLANPQLNTAVLSPKNEQLKSKLNYKLHDYEARQEKLMTCAAPDRRAVVTLTSVAAPVAVVAVAAVAPAVESAPPVVLAPPAAPPVASSDDSGAYFNLNAGYGTQQFLPNGSFAGSLNAGYNFNRAFALEGGAALLSGKQYDVYSAQVIFDLAVKGTLPLSEVFSVYGRLGAGFSNLSYNGTQDNGPAWFAKSSGSVNSMVGLASLGASFKLDRHFDIRIEDNYYVPLANGTATSGNANQALVGLQYNF